MQQRRLEAQIRLAERHELDVEAEIKSRLGEIGPGKTVVLVISAAESFTEDQCGMIDELFRQLTNQIINDGLDDVTVDVAEVSTGTFPEATTGSKDAFFCMHFDKRQIRNAVIIAQQALRAFFESPLAFNCGAEVVVGSSTFSTASLLRYAALNAISLDPEAFAEWKPVSESDVHSFEITRIGHEEIIERLNEQSQQLLEQFGIADMHAKN